MKNIPYPTKSENMDEKKMVQEILSGSERTLWYFYKHFQKSLASYIKNKIADPNDAEEILQDTFLSALEGLRDFSFKSKIFTYLCAIANHKIIDHYRKKKIKSILFSKLSDFEPLVSAIIGPEEKLDDALLREKIQQTFNKLSPKYRRILQLKYVDGFSVDEIAEKLAISFKSAESTLFRARRAFVVAYSL